MPPTWDSTSESEKQATLWFRRARFFFTCGSLSESENALEMAHSYARAIAVSKSKTSHKPGGIYSYFGPLSQVGPSRPIPKCFQVHQSFPIPIPKPKGKTPPEIFPAFAEDWFKIAETMYKQGNIYLSMVALDQWWMSLYMLACITGAKRPDLPGEPAFYFAQMD